MNAATASEEYIPAQKKPKEGQRKHIKKIHFRNVKKSHRRIGIRRQQLLKK